MTVRFDRPYVKWGLSERGDYWIITNASTLHYAVAILDDGGYQVVDADGSPAGRVTGDLVYAKRRARELHYDRLEREG